MFQKLHSTGDSFSLKQAPLITPAQKFGRISRMTTKVTSGRSDVWSTKWLPWCRPSEPQTWIFSTKKYWVVSTLQFRACTRTSSQYWYRLWFRSYLKNVHRVSTSCNIKKYNKFRSHSAISWNGTTPFLMTRNAQLFQLKLEVIRIR